jgi:hypothetical protein
MRVDVIFGLDMARSLVPIVAIFVFLTHYVYMLSKCGFSLGSKFNWN